ncbi:hypothetical protein [Pseudomonas fluorescens]|uniref:hypothetical protein n=1 Tax=Pseudomonas fluorescens TaxID=294 RepID=UPI0017810AEF|nr:hypothetical protein [Pseudomonas fluorescens]
MTKNSSRATPLSPTVPSINSIASIAKNRCSCLRPAYQATVTSKDGRKAPTSPLVFPAAALAPAPAPPALADNLLLASVRNDDLQLSFIVNDNLNPQDEVQLLIDGVLVGPAVAIGNTPPGTAFTIDLAASDRVESLLPRQISYRFFFFPGAGEDDGPSVPFRVDLTEAGRPFLAPLTVDQAIVDEGLTDEQLEGPDGAQFMKSLVASYNDAELGDTIQGFINNKPAPNSFTTVTNPDFNQDVELRFTRDDIEAVGDGTLEFSYQITDRAGNVSAMSRLLTLSVLLEGQLTDLLPPVVPANDNDGIINEAEARGPADVIIPGNARLQPGDTVMVDWGGVRFTEVAIPVAGVTVQAPYAALYDTWRAAVVTKPEDPPVNAIADIDVSYIIIRNGLAAGRSPVTPVRINLFQAGGDPDPETPVHPNLKEAVLTSASGQENVIPIEDFDQPATITVPWFSRTNPTTAVFLLGDRLNLKYGATNLAQYTISATDVGNQTNLVRPLLAAEIAAEGSGTKVLQYTITRAVAGGIENTSLAPPQNVEVRGSDQLPGNGKLKDGRFFPLNRFNAIGPEQIRDGVTFETPHYVNKAIGDEITINIVQALGIAHTPGDQPIEGSRITLEARVTELDVEGVTQFSLPRTQLSFPLAVCHAHVIWTATNEHGTVSNIETTVIIDSRGNLNSKANRENQE